MDAFDELVDAPASGDVFDEIAPEKSDIFDEVESEKPAQEKAWNAWTGEVSPELKAQAPWMVPQKVGPPPSLEPVMAGGAEKVLGPSEQTKKDKARADILKQSIEKSSQAAQRDLTNAELATLGENASRAVDFLGATGRLLGLASEHIGNISEDVVRGDVGTRGQTSFFPRFMAGTEQSIAGPELGPVSKGVIGATKSLPMIAGAMALERMGVPPQMAFGALSASEAAGAGGGLPEIVQAGVVGAAVPESAAIGREIAVKGLKTAVDRGLLSANRTAVQKSLEALGGQVGLQTFFGGLSIPEIAALPPDKRWDAIIQNGIQNAAFLAMDIPKFRRGTPSETLTELISDYRAKQGPMGSVLKQPAERGVVTSIGVEPKPRTLTPATRGDDNPNLWVTGESHADARLKLVPEHGEFQKMPQNEGFIYVDENGVKHWKSRAEALGIFKELTGNENPKLRDPNGLSSEDFEPNNAKTLMDVEQTSGKATEAKVAEPPTRPTPATNPGMRLEQLRSFTDRTPAEEAEFAALNEKNAAANAVRMTQYQQIIDNAKTPEAIAITKKMIEGAKTLTPEQKAELLKLFPSESAATKPTETITERQVIPSEEKRQETQGVQVAQTEPVTAAPAAPPTTEPKPVEPAAAPVAQEGGIVGLGAAEAGEAAPGVQIEQLTQALQNVRESKAPIGEQVKQAFSIGDRLATVKDAIGRALSGMKAAGDVIVNKWRGVEKIDDLLRAKGDLSQAIESRGWRLRKWEVAAKKAIPNARDQAAIAKWVDAGGDRATLERGLAEAPARYKQAYQDALNLSGDKLTSAQNVQNYFEARLQEAIDAGVLEHGIENYIHRIYEGKPDLIKKALAYTQTGLLKTNPGLAKKRAFQFDWEAEKAGYTPVQSFIKRITAYEASLSKAIAAREFIKKASEMKAADGRPIVDIKGVGIPVESAEGVREATLIKPKFNPAKNSEEFLPTGEKNPNYRGDYATRDYRALSRWKWAGTDAGGKPIMVQGDVAIHPDYAGRVDALLKPSQVRFGPYGKDVCAQCLAHHR